MNDPIDTDEVRVLFNLPTEWPDPLGHVRLVMRLCDEVDRLNKELNDLHGADDE